MIFVFRGMARFSSFDSLWASPCVGVAERAKRALTNSVFVCRLKNIFHFPGFGLLLLCLTRIKSQKSSVLFLKLIYNVEFY